MSHDTTPNSKINITPINSNNINNFGTSSKSHTKKKIQMFFCSIESSSKTEEDKKKLESDLVLLGKKRFCTCLKSRCIKRYCDCYSHGEKCNSKVCNCINCHNKKFSNTNSNNNNIINENNKIDIKLGTCCSCQKSGCSKKYCECYTNGQKCNSCCTCVGCCNIKFFEINQNHFIFDTKLKKINIKMENIIIDNYKLKY